MYLLKDLEIPALKSSEQYRPPEEYEAIVFKSAEEYGARFLRSRRPPEEYEVIVFKSSEQCGTTALRSRRPPEVYEARVFKSPEEFGSRVLRSCTPPEEHEATVFISHRFAEEYGTQLSNHVGSLKGMDTQLSNPTNMMNDMGHSSQI